MHDMTNGTLPYAINDADNHFTEPPDLYVRYIDPRHRALAIRTVTDDDGNVAQLYAGQPSKFSEAQITYSAAELERMLGTSAAGEETIPGTLLNRLNPFRGLSDAERSRLLDQFRSQAEAYGDRELRLALMDAQGIDKALMFPNRAHDLEFQFENNVDAIYANARAFNRWIHEEVGFCHAGRMYLPPYLSLADVDLAVAEVDRLIAQGAPVVQLRAGHAHGGRSNTTGGRSLADPLFDPVWARVDEAGVRVAFHLGATSYQRYGADWSEDPEVTFGDFDAFQWVCYWGDRPAMETVAGLILHGFFQRFPRIRVVLSEQGTVWVPYVVRKMDHAFLMGRRAKWATLDRRPSQVFRERFLVAPYPEENVAPVIAAVGVEPLVFGSDFPHGEGLAYPGQYAAAQLGQLTDEQVRLIMRDNLEDFLVPSVT